MSSKFKDLYRKSLSNDQSSQDLDREIVQAEIRYKELIYALLLAWSEAYKTNVAFLGQYGIKVNDELAQKMIVYISPKRFSAMGFVISGEDLEGIYLWNKLKINERKCTFSKPNFFVKFSKQHTDTLCAREIFKVIKSIESDKKKEKTSFLTSLKKCMSFLTNNPLNSENISIFSFTPYENEKYSITIPLDFIDVELPKKAVDKLTEYYMNHSLSIDQLVSEMVADIIGFDSAIIFTSANGKDKSIRTVDLVNKILSEYFKQKQTHPKAKAIALVQSMKSDFQLRGNILRTAVQGKNILLCNSDRLLSSHKAISTIREYLENNRKLSPELLSRLRSKYPFSDLEEQFNKTSNNLILITSKTRDEIPPILFDKTISIDVAELQRDPVMRLKEVITKNYPLVSNTLKEVKPSTNKNSTLELAAILEVLDILVGESEDFYRLLMRNDYQTISLAIRDLIMYSELLNALGKESFERYLSEIRPIPII